MRQSTFLQHPNIYYVSIYICIYINIYIVFYPQKVPMYIYAYIYMLHSYFLCIENYIYIFIFQKFYSYRTLKGLTGTPITRFKFNIYGEKSLHLFDLIFSQTQNRNFTSGFSIRIQLLVVKDTALPSVQCPYLPTYMTMSSVQCPYFPVSTFLVRKSIFHCNDFLTNILAIFFFLLPDSGDYQMQASCCFN